MVSGLADDLPGTLQEIHQMTSSVPIIPCEEVQSEKERGQYNASVMVKGDLSKTVLGAPVDDLFPSDIVDL